LVISRVIFVAGLSTLQIGEVAQRAGVSPRTVRYYEELGLLQQAPRTAAGTRLYGEGDVVRLRFIGRLKALGLSLDEIKLALGSTGPELGHQDRVGHTLELLAMEQRRAAEQIEALGQLKQEVDDAIVTVSKCLSCTAKECPEGCPNRQHLL
jgi:DNA-binding transcriptional MerR regulator